MDGNKWVKNTTQTILLTNVKAMGVENFGFLDARDCDVYNRRYDPFLSRTSYPGQLLKEPLPP